MKPKPISTELNEDDAPYLTKAEYRRLIESGEMRVVLNKNNRLKVLRARLQMSQAEFAKSFNLSLRTVQEWEQGRHKPDKIAQNLLRLIAADPKGAMRILAEGPAE